MSRSTDSFTLLESGTSRLHFKLAKQLEEASSSRHHDQAITETVDHIRKQLASRSFSSDLAKLTSALVTLLHCLHHYPSSAASLTNVAAPIDPSFALLPTLQLLGLATSWKHFLIAHQLLAFLLPAHGKQAQSRDVGVLSSPAASSSSHGTRSVPDDSSSLLLLNTFRASLSAASEHTAHIESRRKARGSSQTRSVSPSASRSHQRSGASSSIHNAALASLKSLVMNIPRGSSVLPSLASTLVALSRHPDSSIRSMTLHAMLSCASVTVSDASDSDGQAEMLEAALTIVRLTLASTYALSAASTPEESQGMILAEMERRVDSSPNVLRTCIKIVEHARATGLISAQEAACLAIETLQAVRWAPMHLEVTSIQPQDLASSVAARTEGLRARNAARQRPSLQEDHNYHGAYAPWLVEACLATLSNSMTSLSERSTPQLDHTTKKGLLHAVLRIYDSASQGKAAALALCIAAARCLGSVYRVHATSSDSDGKGDGELASMWAILSTHVKSQLHSTNPNRKMAGIELLSALLPLGWARATAADAEQTSPLQITEAEMGQLMALLGDPDATIRKRALRLLHRVDPSLTALLRSQLQSAVDEAMSFRPKDEESTRPFQKDVALVVAAQRLVEVDLFAAFADEQAVPTEEAIDALEASLIGAVALNLFGSFADSMQDTWAMSTLISLNHMPIVNRLQLLRGLLIRITDSGSPAEHQKGIYLCCCLLVDLRLSDLGGADQAVEAFVDLVSVNLLGSPGLVGHLVKASGGQRVAVAARETILGVTTRAISLVVNLRGPAQTSKHLSSGLMTLQSTLSKLVETESVAAVRLEASNLQLICAAFLDPLSSHDEGLMTKLKAISVACHTLQDATRSLLELQVEDLPRSQAEDSRSITGTAASTSILATASQLFAPPLRPSAGTRAPSDSFSTVQLRQRLPESVLASSRLLSPESSADTLRSSKQNSKVKPSNSLNRDFEVNTALSSSAIPSEAKRLRDRSIAQALSDSIANLVLGSDAKSHQSDNEIIFSVTSSGIMDADELELIHEVADPDRRLEIAVADGQGPSLLDLVHQCHNHEPWLDTSLTPFLLDGVQIGFLPARVVQACIDDSAGQVRASAPPVLRKVRFAMDHREIVPPSTTTRICEAVTFTKEFTTPEARTAGLNAVAQRWRQARIFPDPLDGWRDELYAVYGLNPQPGSRNPIAFKLERSACALFGFATFGVHLTAYTVEPATGELKVWVPQRSSTKSTWPGYLDNSVAGGIVAGDLPMESMVRECEEEANLEAALVEKYIKQTGVLSYCYKTAKQGWIQPEIEYVYDLPLPPEVTLQPKDGEVDHFELLTLEEIYAKMREGKFKANCVLVLLDFLIRHGHITADKEPCYRQIVAQLHVDLRLPGP
ncbi:thiamine pyrophosphokinase-related protein [Pseudozyma hubeiensis]|nr:thiamine pyrophosphokinase-related protein [Pseudozyma hubeiensis]